MINIVATAKTIRIRTATVSFGSGSWQKWLIAVKAWETGLGP
jgi:hypothetical protein